MKVKDANNMPQSIINKLCERFDRLCVLTEDGKCKYWRPESFGYDKYDQEAPLDKFFPEQVKKLYRAGLLELLEEMEKNLPPEDKLVTSPEWTYGYEYCLSQVKDLLNKMKQ